MKTHTHTQKTSENTQVNGNDWTNISDQWQVTMLRQTLMSAKRCLELNTLTEEVPELELQLQEMKLPTSIEFSTEDKNNLCTTSTRSKAIYIYIYCVFYIILLYILKLLNLPGSDILIDSLHFQATLSTSAGINWIPVYPG